MHIKHSSILAAVFLASSFNADALQIGDSGSPANSFPKALDDHISTVVGVYTTATGNVTSNDLYGTVATLEQSWVGQYGAITVFNSDGTFTYQLFEGTDSASLPPEGVGYEIFTYTYANDSGLSDTAQLIIDVNADPNLTGGSTAPIARDDSATAIPNKIPQAIGNVTTNDSNGNYVQLSSSPSSDYGIIVLQADGSYVYDLYTTSPNVIDLKAGEIVTDNFNYQYFADSGESSTATLAVTIIGNPVDSNGDTIFDQPDDVPYDNVDVEFNNRSAQATPLNSGRNIKGHLYNSSDKDWFFLSSAGDEIITLEVCPQGSSCFGKKSWVLYVFDPDRLKALNDLNDPAKGEFARFQFLRWLEDTGSSTDFSGEQIIEDTIGSSNHMYLAYHQGYFEGALIGVVDPCYDTLNTVDIGVPAGARNYLIALSSPLKGDKVDAESCGQGSLILEEDGLKALGHSASTTETETIIDSDGNEILVVKEVPGEAKSYDTKQEHIVVSPNSDDQYAIKITGTGLNPLNTKEAIAKAASYDPITGNLRIPKVKIEDQYFNADLEQNSQQGRSAESSINFVLSALEELTVDEVVDAYRATYNPDTQQVLIPRVTDTSTGIGYSVILQYHAANGGTDFWFDILSIVEIK